MDCTDAVQLLRLPQYCYVIYRLTGSGVLVPCTSWPFGCIWIWSLFASPLTCCCFNVSCTVSLICCQCPCLYFLNLQILSFRTNQSDKDAGCITASCATRDCCILQLRHESPCSTSLFEKCKCIMAYSTRR